MKTMLDVAWRIAVITLLLSLVWTAKLNERERESPKCRDYGYSGYGVKILNTKNDMLSIQCTGDIDQKYR